MVQPLKAVADLVQRDSGVRSARPHLVESVDEQRCVPPLRMRFQIEPDEVPRADILRRIAKFLTLPFEFSCLSGTGIAEQHVGRQRSERAQRL
ncbi:MAG: hypothetical protein OXI26_05430 [bacterium]|nr:hypothetical protein [bacterium]